MDTALLVVILLLMLLLICFLLFYFFTQQSLRDITARLNVALQPPPPPKKNSEPIRRERALAHDHLMLLEADLTNNPREDLTPEELASIDQISKTIRTCIAELKKSDEWIGIPFDFEWVDILARLPKVNTLYRKAIADDGEFDMPAPTSESQKISNLTATISHRR
jgi:hypothetical protein